MKYEFGRFGLVEQVLYNIYITLDNPLNFRLTPEEVEYYYMIDNLWERVLSLAWRHQETSIN